MPRKLALALVVVAAGVPLGAAAQRITYTDSSSRDKLEGRFDLKLEAEKLAFAADMRLVGQHGETKVLPRVFKATGWFGDARHSCRRGSRDG